MMGITAVIEKMAAATNIAAVGPLYTEMEKDPKPQQNKRNSMNPMLILGKWIKTLI